MFEGFASGYNNNVTVLPSANMILKDVTHISASTSRTDKIFYISTVYQGTGAIFLSELMPQS